MALSPVDFVSLAGKNPVAFHHWMLLEQVVPALVLGSLVWGPGFPPLREKLPQPAAYSACCPESSASSFHVHALSICLRFLPIFG